MSAQHEQHFVSGTHARYVVAAHSTIADIPSAARRFKCRWSIPLLQISDELSPVKEDEYDEVHVTVSDVDH